MSGRIRPHSAPRPHRVDSNSAALLELSYPGDAHSTQPWKTCGGVEMPIDVQLYTEWSLIKKHSLKLCDRLQCFPANCIKQTQEASFMPSVIHQYDRACPLALKGNHTCIKNLYAAKLSFIPLISDTV